MYIGLKINGKGCGFGACHDQIPAIGLFPLCSSIIGSCGALDCSHFSVGTCKLHCIEETASVGWNPNHKRLQAKARKLSSLPRCLRGLHTRPGLALLPVSAPTSCACMFVGRLLLFSTSMNTRKSLSRLTENNESQTLSRRRRRIGSLTAMQCKLNGDLPDFKTAATLGAM